MLLLSLVFLLFSCSKENNSDDSSSLSEEDIVLALKAHNNARKEVGVPNLSWSKTLEADALKWAENMVENEKMFHSSNESRPNQGENLSVFFKTVGGESVFSPTPALDASNAWYNEINDYTYSEIGSDVNANVMIGHYTQMIWSTTTEVGIAVAISDTGKVYVAARYSPPGNYLGNRPY